MLTRSLVAMGVAVLVSTAALPLTGQDNGVTRERAAAGEKDSQKGKEQKKTKDIETALEKGPGVHVVKRDSKGRIHTCLIVGQTRISTVLGKAEGLLNAKTKARLACEAEYVKWIKTSVSVYVKNEKETILFMEGSEENDKETLKESGKLVDKAAVKIESIAEGLMRGFEPVYQNADTKEKIYTLVIRWKSQDAKAVEAIEKGKN